ncbi:hypothetical protein L198_05404 [Cryptococcus wingfieldii CBS 7118]|uniref:Uncharacterized protein n=1 Tax=Cryptococcus wingfieldii CBS 7118 TaxID=1295528 RepID=A0A1E3IY69_9TREE|nr:hypothetical protein L198_05404 [Cryptococcus wingfieldii CBS 7118]ODN93539.1 hypothetical protein L198_05404 [Cryptococcus wingfieldii CBS 7118]
MSTDSPTIEQHCLPGMNIMLFHTGLGEEIVTIRGDGKSPHAEVQCPELVKDDGEEEQEEEEYNYEPEPVPAHFHIPSLTVTVTPRPTPAYDPTRFTDFTLPGGRPAFIPRGFHHKGSRPGWRGSKPGWRMQRERVAGWDRMSDVEERTERSGGSANSGSVNGRGGVGNGVQRATPDFLAPPDQAKRQVTKKRSKPMEMVHNMKKKVMKKMPSFDRKKRE